MLLGAPNKSVLELGASSTFVVLFGASSAIAVLLGAPVLARLPRAGLSVAAVLLGAAHGPDIRRRCVTQPTDHQAILLAHLKLNLPTPPLTDGV